MRLDEITTVAVSKDTKVKLDELKYKLRYRSYDTLINYLISLIKEDDSMIDLRKYARSGSTLPLNALIKMITKEVREKMRTICEEKAVDDYVEYRC